MRVFGNIGYVHVPKEKRRKTVDSVEKSDPDETDPTKPKRTRRQPKPMLIQRN